MENIEFKLGNILDTGSYITLDTTNNKFSVNIDGYKKETKLNLVEVWILTRVFNRLK